MKIGAIFPHERSSRMSVLSGPMPQAVEAMGFNHIMCYDHVIGANRASRPDWKGIYDLDSKFHEPIALLSFIAGVTSKHWPRDRRHDSAAAPDGAGRQAGCHAGPAVERTFPPRRRHRLERGRIRSARHGFQSAAASSSTSRSMCCARCGRNAPSPSIRRSTRSPMPGSGRCPSSSRFRCGSGGIGGGASVHGWAHVDRKVLQRIAAKADGWMPTFDPDDTGAPSWLSVLHGYCREYGRDPATLGIEALLLRIRCTQIGRSTSAPGRNWAPPRCATNVAAPGIQGVDAHLRRLDEIRQTLKTAGLWSATVRPT